jgi:hypothetical protein
MELFCISVSGNKINMMVEELTSTMMDNDMKDNSRKDIVAAWEL